MDENMLSTELQTFVIDKDLRTITIPQNADTLGVVGDIRVNKIEFIMPRYYNGFDMSEFTVRVDYVNANGDSNYYTVKDYSVEDETVVFTWLIDPDMTAYAGNVRFAVKMMKLEGSVVTQRFKTKPASGKVVDGLDVERNITPEEQNDILARIEEEADAYVKSLINGNTTFGINITNHKRSGVKAVVTFIDDDCREETYSLLYPVIKEMKVPYGLACPIQQIGTSGFMSMEHLNEMVNSGCEIASHHLKQYNMDQFVSEEEYGKELQRYAQELKNANLTAGTICYPQGIYVNDYIPIVQKHYDAGFTTDRGINELPLESYFLKRVEVFPRDGLYDLTYVKQYVDQLTQSGGWLIFMTHSWYTSFNADNLKELITYVTDKGIEIAGINDALSNIGNIIECGVIKKPLEYLKETYYCVDARGNIYGNSIVTTEKSSKAMKRVKSGYNAGYNLTVNGSTPSTSDKKRVVSERTTVNPNSEYLITASNVYGNALYVIYDANGAVISAEASANTAAGTIISYKKVVMPANASYVKIASNMNIQPEMYSIYELV